MAAHRNIVTLICNSVFSNNAALTNTTELYQALGIANDTGFMSQIGQVESVYGCGSATGGAICYSCTR